MTITGCSCVQELRISNINCSIPTRVIQIIGVGKILSVLKNQKYLSFVNLQWKYFRMLVIKNRLIKLFLFSFKCLSDVYFFKIKVKTFLVESSFQTEKSKHFRKKMPQLNIWHFGNIEVFSQHKEFSKTMGNWQKYFYVTKSAFFPTVKHFSKTFHPPPNVTCSWYLNILSLRVLLGEDIYKI